MINIPFTHILRNKRRNHNLNQTQAAALIGMTAKRWNNIELGKRPPNPVELRQMQELLGPLGGAIRPKGIHKLLLDEGLRAVENAEPFFPPADRPAFTRYYAALQRCPELVKELTATIADREDFAACDYLCDRIAFGSYAESLFGMHLLAQGARPALAAPAWLPSALPYPLIDPQTREHVCHRPFPCLILGGVFYFFQMSLDTPRTFTVDVLRWRGKWSVIEIDGDGHDSGNDREREAVISLPFLRYKASDLERGDFLAA